MPHMPDNGLIQQLIKGNERSLRKFYVSYSPKLRNFILQRVSDPKDAEEILQDALLSFLDALRDFTGKSSLYTYLCAIAKYKTIDYYRKKKIKKIVFSKIPSMEKIYALATIPEDKLDKLITEKNVQDALGRMRPKYQTALRLKYFKDLSVKQVAAKMGISFKAAESILFRARREFALIYAKRPTLPKSEKSA